MVEFTDSHVMFSFNRKARNFRALVQALAIRAASVLQWEEYLRTHHLPAEPCGHATVELVPGHQGFAFFHSNDKTYMLNLRNTTYDDRTKKFSGMCEVFEQEEEEEN